MILFKDIRNFRMYNKQVLLPLNTKNKQKGSFIIKLNKLLLWHCACRLSWRAAFFLPRATKAAEKAAAIHTCRATAINGLRKRNLPKKDCPLFPLPRDSAAIWVLTWIGTTTDIRSIRHVPTKTRSRKTPIFLMIFGKGERRCTFRTTSEHLSKSTKIVVFWHVSHYYFQAYKK